MDVCVNEQRNIRCFRQGRFLSGSCRRRSLKGERGRGQNALTIKPRDEYDEPIEILEGRFHRQVARSPGGVPTVSGIKKAHAKAQRNQLLEFNLAGFQNYPRSLKVTEDRKDILGGLAFFACLRLCVSLGILPGAGPLGTPVARWPALQSLCIKPMSRRRIHYFPKLIIIPTALVHSAMKNIDASEQSRRMAIYDDLHQQEPLRFSLEDYPVFCSWLNVPCEGENLKLLDIACGQGFFLQVAEKCAPRLELHGLDFSQVALDFAAKRVSRTSLKKGSAYDLPYPDGYFDYCVNLGSLEHFDDPRRAMAEFGRVLKPTGKAMIIVPNQFYLGNIWRVYAYGEAEEQGQEGVTNSLTVKQWTRLLLDSGLDVTGTQGYNGDDHIAWYFKRRDGKMSEEERGWRIFLDTFIKPAIPLNLSQCFVFFLRRQP
jgi:SAM-dependent methyltransferase